VNGNGHWKTAAVFLAGVVVALLSFYATSVHKMLTREESMQLINDMRPGPPWIQDRGRVMQILDDHQRQIEELRRHQ
jgi:hypothetical protein